MWSMVVRTTHTVMKTGLRVNARYATNAQTHVALLDRHAPRVPHEVDARRQPPPKVQLTHVTGGLMIAPDHDGEAGRHLLTRVVLVERAHLEVLGWTGHGLHVVVVANGLHVYIRVVLESLHKPTTNRFECS